MKKSLIFFLFGLFTIQNSYCQDIIMGCLTELIESDELKSQTCSKSSSTYVDFYSNKEFFIPKEIDKPITIHVNFNVWQRSDGTGNLSNNTTHVNRIKKIFSWVNSHFFDLTSFSVPLSYSVNNLPDSKIRIQLDSIYFYQDPSIDSLYYYGNVYGFNFCNGDTVIRHYPSNLLLEQYIQDNYLERN